MPNVRRQPTRKKKKATSVTTQRKKTGTIADRIVDVSKLKKGIKINIYGRGKSGKTRLACTFPKPLLILGTEDGTESVKNVKGVKYLRLENGLEVDEAVAIVKEDGYATVVLDTGGGLQELIVRDYLGLDDVPIQKSWGMAKQSDWGPINAQTKERFRNLLTLAETDGTNVAIIAHERAFDTDNESDLIFPTVGAALTPGVASWLDGACDYVCQTFIRSVMETSEMEVGDETVEMETATGKSEYCLRVGPHPVYKTGFRLPVGTVLPDVIVNPSYKKIHKLIQGG